MRPFYYIIGILCMMFYSLKAQNISSIEYSINTDPGVGNATKLTGFTPSSNIVNYSTNIDLSTCPNGFNTLFFRSKDASGKWSLTNTVTFVKVGIGLTNIVKAEYSFDGDSDYGKGTVVSLTNADTVKNQSLSLNVSSLSNGIHTLHVRTQDASGKWSFFNNSTFIKESSISNLVALEYFIDTDPGIGLANQVGVVAASKIDNYVFQANISSYSNGTHNLFVRTKDANNHWSLNNIISFKKTVLTTGETQTTDVSVGYKVYPNPSHDVFHLQYPADQTIKKINMIDMSGSSVQVKVSNHENEKQIDVTGLKPGNYFISIVSDKGLVYKKVIVN